MAGIVHLGLGNFHRAHQAVYTAAAPDGAEWGILAAASSSRTVVDALRRQDLRYHVVEISPAEARISAPAVHTGVLVAAEETDALLAAIAAEETRMITLTVTEHGYSYSPKTLGLDLDSPDVRHDLAEAAPRTPIGQIARGLQRRARTHGRGITVLSCDNLAENGRHTRRLVREFVAALPDPALAEWIDESVTFPNAMVDRIVPATTDETRRIVAERLGVEDAVPVPAEPFTMWVLEDDFAQGRPRWEAGGAIFTDDVSAYELLKLRLLNGTHSLIAYLGLLSGARHVADSVARPFVERAARRVMAEDYLPTFTPPEAIDVEQYIEQLFARFSNSALGHRAAQVGSDGSLKLPQRITEPVLWHQKQGRVPGQLALTVAAYLCCLDTGIRDPALERLRALDSGTAREFVEAVFHKGQIFAAELAECSGFTELVAELVEVIRTHGAAQAAAIV
ncbi:mannitol dehydrogenase family protein [Amycolatopsis alkalitolerans]|uniref:Mannitol-1-phosphate 5-dehydrogenase n=1 Tax=Amycolatopsis alkalitolerans TaxID=2547244 RepID=A0A5C4M308_9PSEU|nr:mannitol dehydrogenase family protein [Amycolatopsis alkalitolerans]TNC26560.1 mannitol dehydrogenase family protein [Amycolatopsis alkalitolerans]